MEDVYLTDKQAKRVEILTRLDEIDKWYSKIKDEAVREEMRKQKEALRHELDTL